MRGSARSKSVGLEIGRRAAANPSGVGQQGSTAICPARTDDVTAAAHTVVASRIFFMDMEVYFRNV